jgi:hypothetical protein
MAEIGILSIIEPFVEVLNLVIAIIIVAYGLIIAKILKSDLKKIWRYLLVTVLFFGLHEIVGSLEEFGVLEIEGLYALTELLFIVAFLFAIYKFHQFFKSIKAKVK